SLPSFSIRPYAKYGVGLQKKWGDRFTGFAQAFVTSGGRNGVGLQAGLKVALGNETDKKRVSFRKPAKKQANIDIKGKNIN
ncbi:hypothetical protein II906_06100, partial [bacterium]|nr:hypothetical protein [bacterium]